MPWTGRERALDSGSRAQLPRFPEPSPESAVFAEYHYFLAVANSTFGKILVSIFCTSALGGARITRGPLLEVLTEARELFPQAVVTTLDRHGHAQQVFNVFDDAHKDRLQLTSALPFPLLTRCKFVPSSHVRQ